MKLYKVFIHRYQKGKPVQCTRLVVSEDWRIISSLPDCQTDNLNQLCKKLIDKYGPGNFHSNKVELDLFWDANLIREEVRTELNIKISDPPKNFKKFRKTG